MIEVAEIKFVKQRDSAKILNKAGNGRVNVKGKPQVFPECDLEVKYDTIYV